jgi:hypothetical protein
MIVNRVRGRLIFLICLLFILSIAGCQKISTEADLESAVKSDTVSILDEHPAWATEAIFVSGLGIAAIEENPDIQVSVLKAQIVDEVNVGNLSPGDKILASLFIEKITGYMDDYFKANGITDNAEQIKVNRKVLGWVNEIAASKLQSVLLGGCLSEYIS